MSSYQLFLSGAESPSHRKSLRAAAAPNQAVNLAELANRMGATGKARFDEWFEPDVGLCVYVSLSDKARAEKGNDWWARIEAVVEDWLVRFDVVVIPDNTPRPGFWEDLSSDSTCSVWPATGTPWTAATGEMLGNRETTLAFARSRRDNPAWKLLGLGVVDQKLLMSKGLDASTCVSWTGAQRHRELAIWDGALMRRFTSSKHSVGFNRYRGHIERVEGVDVEKVELQDPEELTKLSLWSWMQLERFLSARKRSVPDIELGDPSEGGSAHSGSGVDIESQTAALPALPREERSLLPVIVADPDSSDEEPLIGGTATASLLRCDTCFLQATCPAFTPSHACAYDIPVSIRTRSQFEAVLSSVVEMQFQRVAMLRMAEQSNGGHPDPTLSDEMDRLFRISKQMTDALDDRDTLSLSLEAKGSGGGASGGILEKIFGPKGQAELDKIEEVPIRQVLAVVPDVVPDIDDETPVMEEIDE